GFYNYRLLYALDKSGPVVKKTEESHQLTCTYDEISNDNAAIGWIRQAPGKGLECVAYISAPSSSIISYSQSVKNRFTISRDNSMKQVYLQFCYLRAEDTAVYYCIAVKRVVFALLGIRPCNTVYGAYFDYWGKGTTVTVSSAATVSPSLFPLLNCGTPANDFYSIGCIATGFSPSSLTFKWTDDNRKALTEFVQYPAVLSGGTYTAVSQLPLVVSLPAFHLPHSPSNGQTTTGRR
uniref:Ig-like domain-containing protein n=1 Tax=Hucho hucho TaxID=62062 RepID=A0A4W5LJS7_9TELE